MIRLAKDIRAADRRGEDLGLDFREYAFYTALEVNDSSVAVLAMIFCGTLPASWLIRSGRIQA
jgi:hypothetical protein